jgi:hypothetical protein
VSQEYHRLICAIDKRDLAFDSSLRDAVATFGSRTETDPLSLTVWMMQLKAFIAKNPPQSDAQLLSFNQMILTVQQNINWYTANNQSLKDWLVAINGATSTSRSTARLMPASPLDYWYSMDTEVHSEQIGRSLKY